MGRLTAFTDNKPSASILTAHFDEWKKAFLRQHPWNFAIQRTTLDTPTTPEFDFDYSYTRETDDLRVLEVGYPEDNYEWVVEKREILCNIGDEIYVKYIQDQTLGTDTEPMFADALSLFVAIKLAEAGVKTSSVLQEVKDDYVRALSRAKSVDGQEGSPIYESLGSWAVEMGRGT
jgi:hypothetical protein